MENVRCAHSVVVVKASTAEHASCAVGILIKVDTTTLCKYTEFLQPSCGFQLDNSIYSIPGIPTTYGDRIIWSVLCSGFSPGDIN